MIKKLLLTAALLAVTSTAKADRVDDLCNLVSKNASKIMELRQSGTTMKEVLDLVKGSELFKRLTVEAYSKPKYLSDSDKVQATAAFGNSVRLVCLETFGKVSRS